MLETDDCLDGLSGAPGERGPGLKGGRSSEAAEELSVASFFLSLS